MPKKDDYLYVARLSEDAVDEAVESGSPNRDPWIPVVKMGYLAGALPKSEGTLSHLQAADRQLSNIGYMVYNRPLRKYRRLYVIELAPAILDARQPNHAYSESSKRQGYRRQPIYMDQRGKSREDRLQNHKQGHYSPDSPTRAPAPARSGRPGGGSGTP